jgi:hypothetical protein
MPAFDTVTFRDVLDAHHLRCRFETHGPLLKVPLNSEKSLVQNETRLDNASSALERVNRTIAREYELINQQASKIIYML